MKRLILALVITAGLIWTSIASATHPKTYYVETSQFSQGVYSRIANVSNYLLYCYIGYAEFYVHPYQASRWYMHSGEIACVPVPSTY